MSSTKTTEAKLNVRAEVPESTHKALKIRQSKKEIETGVRPHITEVVSSVLTEWAALQID